MVKFVRVRNRSKSAGCGKPIKTKKRRNRINWSDRDYIDNVTPPNPTHKVPPAGTCIASRAELQREGYHCRPMAGINVSNGSDPATSVVVSGGKYRNRDYGDVIWYNAQGAVPQEMTRYNASLWKAHKSGIPVNVWRGHKHRSDYSPTTGYKFAGRFFVTRTRRSVNMNLRFKLVKMSK